MPNTKPRSAARITKLQPTLGAEIRNVDLRLPISDTLHSDIHAALLEHKVLVFPDQGINGRQLVAFAEQFGCPEEPDTLQKPPIIDEAELVKGLDYVYWGPELAAHGTDHWHSDWSGAECPTMGLILHALKVPEVGGDTLFVDMVAAYRGLPEAMKTRLEGLYAIHDTQAYFDRYPNPFLREEQTNLSDPQRHPVVRRHPETGEPILYVNELFTRAIADLEPSESADLLDFLLLQATVPEYQLRYRWQPNSVIFIDNRCTQHYACADYWPSQRCLQRVILAGDKPIPA